MGNTLMKTVKCEADPTILPPPPPMTTMAPAPEAPIPIEAGPRVDPRYKDNPGTMEELHKRSKEILPNPLEGAKVIVNKSLSPNFQITHNLSMSSIQPSGYRYGSTFVGSMISPTEPSALLMGDIDPSGNLNSQGFYHVTEDLKVKWVAQVSKSKFQNLQTSFDYKGSCYTASGSLVNPSFQTESMLGVLQYLHAVTPKVALGGEAVYQKSPAIPEGSILGFTASARYSDQLNSVSGFYGNPGAGLYLYRRINDELQIGLEIERVQQQLSASVAYQYDLPKANFTMKGMVDSNWTVTGMLEKRLLPLPCSFALCASINHKNNQFRMGCQVALEL